MSSDRIQISLHCHLGFLMPSLVKVRNELQFCLRDFSNNYRSMILTLAFQGNGKQFVPESERSESSENLSRGEMALKYHGSPYDAKETRTKTTFGFVEAFAFIESHVSVFFSCKSLTQPNKAQNVTISIRLSANGPGWKFGRKCCCRWRRKCQ